MHCCFACAPARFLHSFFFFFSFFLFFFLLLLLTVPLLGFQVWRGLSGLGCFYTLFWHVGKFHLFPFCTVHFVSAHREEILTELAASGAKDVYVDGGETIRGFLAAGLLTRRLANACSVLGFNADVVSCGIPWYPMVFLGSVSGERDIIDQRKCDGFPLACAIPPGSLSAKCPLLSERGDLSLLRSRRLKSRRLVRTP